LPPLRWPSCPALFLILLGVFRLGFLANFLSHPVIAGFITASGILIAMSQLRHVLGISAGGATCRSCCSPCSSTWARSTGSRFAIGVSATAFLFWVRKGLMPLLLSTGMKPKLAGVLAKAGPVAAVFVTTLAAWVFNLGETAGVRIVGDVPQGLPPLTMPSFSPDLLGQLIGPAVLISIIGFVESVSVAQTLAARKRQRIVPDQELIGLGAANVGAAFTGGYPVTGGFARSVVNFDAGRKRLPPAPTPRSDCCWPLMLLTPLIYNLPQATLAATIIVAVLSLVDFSILKKTWTYSRADFAAVTATIALTLLFGVEVGVTAGVLLSILIHLYKSSRPHMAVVGRVPGTEHFRNVKRHKVEIDETVLTLRVDESLYFANARYLEDSLYDMVAARPQLKHVVLMCPAVNEIDMSALESLEAINERLHALGVTFHLSEVKGPVMDRLRRGDFLQHLSGKVFLSQHQAALELAAGPSQTRITTSQPN
jgi:SulP family sulfate permease